MGQDLEGHRLQRVAGEDGGRLVIGGMDAGVDPEAGVRIHARQVVVDDGIGVDAFQRAGRAQHRPLVQVEHLGRLEGEEGPQAPAGPEGGVAHRLGQARFGAFGARQQLVQRDRHEIGGFGYPFGEGQGFHASHRAASMRIRRARPARPDRRVP